MWSLKSLARLVAVIGLAGLTAGCFQPMYGTASVGQTAGLGDKMSTVDVAVISAPNGTREARLGNVVRNNLIFATTGGGAAAAPDYRLDIRLSSSQTQVIVDINTGRPDVVNFGLDATYTLTELSTGKKVLTSQTFSRVSYNIPGQEQRFAGDRGQRDAETRAATVISDNIRNRLASYFVAGT
jgi:LPS-assembly lipoprotein